MSKRGGRYCDGRSGARKSSRSVVEVEGRTDNGMAMEEAMKRSQWPICDLLSEDSTRRPTIVTDVDIFLDKMAFGNHMDDIVVFRGGLEALKQRNAMPPAVLSSARNSETVSEFLRNFVPTT